MNKEELRQQLTGEKPIRAYLAPDVILKFLVGKDEKVNDLLKLPQKKEMSLVVSNFALYEAVECLKEGELILDNLKKLLYVTETMAFPENKSIQEFLGKQSFAERKKKLRKTAELK